MSLCKLVQKQQVNHTVMVYKNNIDPVQKRYWPGTKAILTWYKSDTDPVQKRYWPGAKAIPLIPFIVPLHNVSVPAVPEPVTSPVLVYGTGTCTGTVCKTYIKRYCIGTLYRIRYRTGTTYHHWTEPERVPIYTGMFTGLHLSFPKIYKFLWFL